jgi:nicotinamide mononucleotide transporter
MSIYGWFFWSKKDKGNFKNKISGMNLVESIFGLTVFILSFFTIMYLYNVSNWQESYVSSIDTFTTAIFCSAMWFMARRKVEHWILWIIGDVISVPLYFYKGLYLTSIQYLIFTIIAILGFFTWLKELNKNKLTVKGL